MPIGTEYSTSFNGVVAVYCAAFQDGDFLGVVKIGAKKPYANSLYDGSYSEKVEDAYKDWIVEDLTVLNSVNQKESLVICGMTAQMPEFSMDPLESLLIGSDLDERIEKKKLFNAQLEDTTLLDATVGEPDKTQKAKNMKQLAHIVLVVDVLLLAPEFYFMIRKKCAEKMSGNELTTDDQ